MDSADAGNETAPRRPMAGRRGDNTIGDFFAFRVFIAPVVIQVLFWLGVFGAVIYALIGMYTAVRVAEISFSAALIPLFVSIVMLVIGPIVVRVYCEVIMVFFRIYDTLQEIRDISARK